MVAQKYIMAIGMIIIAALAFAVGIFAGPLLLQPGAGTDTVWDRVVKDGKIKVGTEAGWPPYEFLNTTNNQIVGFEIELTEAIAAKLGLEVEWQNMLFDAIIPSIDAKDIDLGVSGFSVTAERLDVVQFTMPHSITEGQIIMLESKRDSLGITMLTSLDELEDRSLHCGTQTGTTQQEELLEKIPSSLVASYTTYLDALTAMKNDLIDCVYAETPITSNWILEAEQASEEPIVVIFKRPYYPVAFVVHKDSDTFAAKINGALAEIIASGELDTLKAKWKC